ncbi:MAG: chemotaxis protein CheA [Proteobacteria bacterium]|nr:chemotaxis protein CheA [Pseudomonadota bacterium]
MDDIIQEFVTETNESLALLDQEMVKFEQQPNDADTLSRIFRVMHTIKGTCGFLGLPRLEKVAHAGEDVLGKFRDGVLVVSQDAVTLILRCLDRIREMVQALEQTGAEPEGEDSALINELRAMADGQAPAPAPMAAAPAESPKVVPVASGGFPVAQDLLDECAAAEGAPVQAAKAAETKIEEPKPESIAKPAVAPKPAAAAAPVERNEDKAGAQTIRVSVDVLENLMTLVSEMVLTRNQLQQISRSHADTPFKGPIQRLNRVTTDLQESVMKTRMQAIGHAWNKLPRIVRDLANELGKKINLEMHGEETELDRQVLEMIRDPLTHMVRNSADHGLEGPAERSASGKSDVGTIRLSAHHEGGHIIITIADNGRGLNTARIKQKVLEKGLATAAELDAMEPNQIHQFIMRAGFSTAEKITNVSGRGVGMDVVRSNIEKIGGTVEFVSTEGQGSTFTIKIPLTLAIVSALIVESAGQRFAVPQIAVREVVRANTTTGPKIEELAGAPVLRLRNRLLPLVRLRSVLALDDANAGANVIVCRSGNQIFGVVVDRIADAEEIVVKPLNEMTKGAGFYSGNTILGDGAVVLILDVNALAGCLHAEAQATGEEDVVTGAGGGSVQNILLFRTKGDGVKAVPLSEVHRIENFSMDQVEWVQGQPVIQYRDRMLPLRSYDGVSGIRREGHQPVLVFIRGDEWVGLAIEKIEDIKADEVRIERPSAHPGLRGSQIVGGKAVDYIEPAYFVAPVGAKPAHETSSFQPTLVYGEAA